MVDTRSKERAIRAVNAERARAHAYEIPAERLALWWARKNAECAASNAEKQEEER